MRILVSGASGLIGQELVRTLLDDGQQVLQLVRRPANTSAKTTEFQWDPDHGAFDSSRLGHIDAAINLGGVPIADKRWSAERKLQISESRVRSTRLIAQALASLPDPPAVFICASAVGYYGNRGEEPLTEESGPGEGFLADTALRWEEATDAARAVGIRTINARFGLVLSHRGGYIGKIQLIFQSALGGKVGNGRQWWSWITLQDAINALSFCIANKNLEGPVNFTSPSPVRNEEMTRAIGKTLHRPTWFTVPRPMLKLMFGQMGEETMLHSQLAYPTKLQDAGFEWNYPELMPALQYELISARSDRWGSSTWR
jgi:uncharacterized protein (TIGR01777 family)